MNDDNVRFMSEAGLDFIISGAAEEYLDMCEKYGVGVIAQSYCVPHSSQNRSSLPNRNAGYYSGFTVLGIFGVFSLKCFLEFKQYIL